MLQGCCSWPMLSFYKYIYKWLFVIDLFFFSSLNTITMFTELSHLSYDLTVRLLSFLVYIFFREVRPRGSHRIPKEGPVIFVVAPHANQFLDPLLVMKECGRRTSMLIAEKSMHQRGIGTFARMLNASKSSLILVVLYKDIYLYMNIIIGRMFFVIYSSSSTAFLNGLFDSATL